MPPVQLPVPERIREACARGVITAPVPPIAQATQCLAAPQACEDGVRRAPDGRVLVTCMTEMPGITPAMIDWWFGWHLTDSARYRLWHPRDHVRCSVKEDRTGLSDDKQRYIGNVSYVDEYIGPKLMKLAIAFQPPQAIGFDTSNAQASTTIFGTTADRVLGGQGGHLVHHVVRHGEGVQMRSGFWLGQITHQQPMVQALAARLLNSAPVRRVLVPDKMAVNLLMHCAEEMNHLGTILAELYHAHR
jgi:DAPG hydrolase PhiG domain